MTRAEMQLLLSDLKDLAEDILDSGDDEGAALVLKAAAEIQRLAQKVMRFD